MKFVPVVLIVFVVFSCGAAPKMVVPPEDKVSQARGVEPVKKAETVSVPEWKYRLEDVLVEITDENGTKRRVIDIKVIDYFLDRISVNAKGYPPKFTSDQQQREVTVKLYKLIGVLEILGSTQQENPDFLTRVAYANGMGHNLGIVGCAERSMDSYESLLRIEPENIFANYHYGMFLAASQKSHFESIPFP